MMNVASLFFIVGAIIFIGFLADILFTKTGVSDVLILMLLGILLGPILKIIPSGILMGASPYFVALALIMLLLEGGMHLNFYKVITQFPKASAFTFSVFAISAFLTTIIAIPFGWNPLHGLLLGMVVGGTSSAIIIPTLSKLKIEEDVKTILILESAFTDALCVIMALAIIPIIISNTISVQDTLHTIASSFSIAGMVGGMVGLMWIKILRGIHDRPLTYLLTIATCFVMYSFVESIRGNGTVAALVFGLVLGNAKEISQIFKMEEIPKVDMMIERFHGEVSFFIRTFFFVYVGMLFDPAAFTPPVVALSILVMTALLFTRYFVAGKFMSDRPRQTIELMGGLLPRGLAAAALSFIPATYGLEIPYFTEVVLVILFLSNAIMVAEVYRYKKAIKEGSGERKNK